MGDKGQCTADILAVVIENRELRQQLAEVQDQCVELAVDAGELHAKIEELRGRPAQTERERDAWKAEAARRDPLQGFLSLPLTVDAEHW